MNLLVDLSIMGASCCGVTGFVPLCLALMAQHVIQFCCEQQMSVPLFMAGNALHVAELALFIPRWILELFLLLAFVNSCYDYSYTGFMWTFHLPWAHI